VKDILNLGKKITPSGCDCSGLVGFAVHNLNNYAVGLLGALCGVMFILYDA